MNWYKVFAIVLSVLLYSYIISDCCKMYLSWLKARGLFRNLGKKITKAMRENEERDERHIWNELKENEFKSMNILPPSLFSPSEIKGPPLQWDFRIPEKEEEQE